MSFNEILALIFPSIIAMLLYLRFMNRKINLVEIVCVAATINLITNCLSYAFMIYVWHNPGFDFSPTFTLKYSVMATVIALVVVTIFRMIELNVTIKLKVESEDEN